MHARLPGCHAYRGVVPISAGAVKPAPPGNENTAAMFRNRIHKRDESRMLDTEIKSDLKCIRSEQCTVFCSVATINSGRLGTLPCGDGTINSSFSATSLMEGYQRVAWLRSAGRLSKESKTSKFGRSVLMRTHERGFQASSRNFHFICVAFCVS